MTIEMSASKPVPDDEEEGVEKTVPENKLTSDNLEEEFQASLKKWNEPSGSHQLGRVGGADCVEALGNQANFLMLLLRHRSQRFKSINSLRGITALGSRCPSHPLFVGACPRSGSRRGTGTIRTRRPTACAWRPLRRRRGPGKPRQQPHWNGELWARARGVAGPPAPVSPAECGWGTQTEAGTFRNPGARPGAESAPGPAEIPHGAAQPRRRPLTPISRGVGARARARPHRSARAHGGAGSPAAQDETEGMESSSWFENSARALKPGLARPECAFAAWELSGPASCPVRAVPALLRPGSRLGSEPRAACSGMPRYELALILKAMQRPETAAALKRTLETLMDRGAVVRNLENLGERALPYRISAHSQQHTRGGYFLVDFYAPTTTVEGIMEHLSRDIDVIRPNIVKHPLTQEVKECEGIVPVPLEEKLYSTKKRK
nr:small ribosomal subunit protein bS6m [Delphinus delphis]